MVQFALNGPHLYSNLHSYCQNCQICVTIFTTNFAVMSDRYISLRLNKTNEFKLRIWRQFANFKKKNSPPNSTRTARPVARYLLLPSCSPAPARPFRGHGEDGKRVARLPSTLPHATAAPRPTTMPRPSTLRLARAESLAHSEDKENAPPPAAPQPFSKDPFGAPRAVGPLGTLAGPAHDSDSPTSVFDAGSAHVLPTYDACGRFGEGGSADGASVADSGDGGSDGDGVGEVMDARQWMGEVDGGGVDDVDVEAAEAATPDRVRPLRPVSAPAVRSPLMDITQVCFREAIM